MAYTYSTFVSALVAETNIEAANAGFVAILPTIIDQAEGLIYREPDFYFMSATVIDDTGFTTPNSQQFTLPRRFTVLESVNLVQGNSRPPLDKVSREWLQAVYTMRLASSVSDVPTKWAPLTDNIILLGPVPGGTTQLECVGNARPANLSADNPMPWLWTYLGDLAFAAAMIYMSGYMRNFGSQADDAAMAVSWKGVYDTLKAGVAVEEMRRKHEATA